MTTLVTSSREAKWLKLTGTLGITANSHDGGNVVMVNEEDSEQEVRDKEDHEPTLSLPSGSQWVDTMAEVLRSKQQTE